MKKIIIMLLVLFPLNVFAINANSYVVMDADNGRILLEKNSNKKSLIASTTKIMTAILAIENGNLQEKIVVTKDVLKSYGSSIYVEVGEELTLKDLLYGLMLRSGNDAAILISNNIAGSMDDFAMLMNKKAKALGMNNTHFINSHGLENSKSEGNISTAYDMAILMRYAMNNPIFKEIVKTQKYLLKTNYKSYEWINKNKLLFQKDYITGGKTGYTIKAKRTLVTSATKNNKNIIVVTLNDPNDFKDHISLYEKVFSEYNLVKAIDSKKALKCLNDIKNINIRNDYYILLKDDEINNVSQKIIIYKNTPKDSNVIGNIDVYFNNVLLHRENIYKNIVKINKKEGMLKKILRWLKW